MKRLVESLPANVEVYLVGGAMRNAMMKKYHGEEWLQRDYDQIVTKDSDEYFAYLYENGYLLGELDRPSHKVVVKPIVDNARKISYSDNFVFDIHMVDGTTIEYNMKYGTGLLINGCALSMRDLFAHDWEDRLIELPGSIETIKQRQIRVNQDGYASESNYFFACIRFIGVGFAPPPKHEFEQLLAQVSYLESERYKRNLVKSADYIGSKEKMQEIVAATFGDAFDVFDEAGTKEYACQLMV